MGKSYRECPACGKRALSIATRCPACGQALLDQPVRRQEPATKGNGQSLALVLGVVLLALVVSAALIYPRHAPRVEATASAIVPDESPVALDTVRVAASPVMPDSAPSALAVPRVARTWTKVHERRSVKADLSAVLLPGDTVLADSLKGGWWRVALEGKVIGYVSAETLLRN